MWLAGIPVPDRAVLELTRQLRDANLTATAERLKRASDRKAKIVALDVIDREAILRVLEDCPDACDVYVGAKSHARTGARMRRANRAYAVTGEHAA